MNWAIWTLAGLYVLVGIGLFYSLAIDSDELFPTVTAVVFALMGPMAYLVYKKQVSNRSYQKALKTVNNHYNRSELSERALCCLR